MNRTLRILMSGLFTLPLLAGCGSETKFPEGVSIFSPQLHLISSDFDGLGVEWGAYEDTNKLIPNAWERIEKYANRLDGMALVRCMVNYDWFVEDLDTKGDKDKTNDTWHYNFNNKYMQSTIDVLTYCQLNDVHVAFGAWNVVGTLKDDKWGMMDEVTSDPRWAKMSADVLEYLVLKKGFTCIKYFVNSNEPNYKGIEGSSKNYNNTFEKWKKGVLNVRKALDAIGLQSIGIVGGDATGSTGIDEYLVNISKDEELKKAVGDYGFHLYSSKMYIDNGTLMDSYNTAMNTLKTNDPEINKTRKVHIWECGLLDGKDNTSDCQKLITEFSYANAMADFTLESIACGVNGIAYWDFDDAMHFMYQSNGTVNPKEWGMFSSLNSASIEMQALRPWYHSSTLLINLLRRHNTVFDSGENNSKDNPGFRSIATISNDKKHAGVIFSNNRTERTVKFVLDQKYENDEKMYVYIFNSKYMLLGEDGFIKPNYVINGSMNNINELTIPSSSFVVVSNEAL